MVQPTNFPHILLAENKTIWELIVILFTLHWTMPLYLVRHCQVSARAFSQPSELQASSNAELLQASFLLVLHLSCLLLYSSHDSCLPITEPASQAKWVFLRVFPKQVLIITKQGWDHVIAWGSNFPLVVPEHKTNSLSGNYSVQFA